MTATLPAPPLQAAGESAAPRIGLVIPTRDAGPDFPRLLDELDAQDCPLARRLIIDTSSRDGTAEQARRHGFEVRTIAPVDFGHGRTRQLAADLLAPDADAILYLTQDVRIPDSAALSRLAHALLAHPRSGAAYGRQLPARGASRQTCIERAYSYPAESREKTLADRAALGLRAPFLSDAFAIYRTRALADVGGFPVDAAICEDLCVGARLLLAGYTICYAADACVRHSHELTLAAACRRYYAMGAFQHAESWIGATFGGGGSQGLRVLRRQLAAAGPRGGARTAASYLLRGLAYALGRAGL